MPIKKKGGMGRIGQCPLRNLVARALPIGQWALNGHLSFTTLSIFCNFELKSKGFSVPVKKCLNFLLIFDLIFFVFDFFFESKVNNFSHQIYFVS